MTLSSCGVLSSWFGSPPKEDPVSPDEQYLPTGGNSVDLGPDQATAMQRLQSANSKIRELEDQIGKLTGEKGQVETRLNSTTADLSLARAAQAKAIHTADELVTECRELKTKILMLQIENAQLEQAKILMRLAAIRSVEDAANSATAQPMPMSGANR
jgi:chromosome segregation ATPase